MPGSSRWLAASTNALFLLNSFIPTVIASDAWYNIRLNPCPVSCQTAGGDAANWTYYHDTDRLSYCNQSMLLDFNIHNGLNDPDSHVSIRACSAVQSALETSTTSSNNSCPTSGAGNLKAQFSISQSSSSQSNTGSLAVAAEKIQSSLSNGAACDLTTSFSYLDGATVGVYIGENIVNQAIAKDVLDEFIDYLQVSNSSETVVAEYCRQNSTGTAHSIGLIASMDPTLADVQNAISTWSTGACVLSAQGSQPWKTFSLSTLLPTNSSNIASPKDAALRLRSARRSTLVRRDTCSNIQVQAGDSCGSLAQRCGISGAQFTQYNSDPNLCSTLQPGQHVCCSAGTMPDFAPRPQSDGTCATYTIASGDTCSALASTNSITVDDISKRNSNTWQFMGCGDLQIGQVICLSTGNPPMPAAVANAECGPQVAGTQTPANISQPGALASLNPCQLNACCDIWGQCGTTSDFCTVSSAASGAPGTAAPGTNGCISNCGTNITEGPAPATQYSVGYFEGWNVGRDCLTMDASQISTDGTYTHVHFGFANISDSYTVQLAGTEASQFDTFQGMSGFKRIISFGGWAFSTDPSTYQVFRNVVQPDNRQTFINSLVQFLGNYNLDGVDFDWEYPGEPDIPGIPAGSSEDGSNYLGFLRDLRSALPSQYSLSIAAPASYWYLRAFPIADISKVVDYIVYMAYDLHGQWDYGNHYSDPGCADGNCLRSHVNLTETVNALSMVTKAGVSTDKIVVGVSSYGRSFQMSTAGCTGPMCTYTGPDSGAWPGECTATAGILANAEIYDILSDNPSASTWYDTDSNSDIMVYNDTQWVAFMSDNTRTSRTGYYKSLNFLGTVDWAIDQQYFVDSQQYAMDPLPDCDAYANYLTIDQVVNDASIPSFCTNIYTLNALAVTMETALTNFTNIMNDGYSDKFNAYQEQVQYIASIQWTKFQDANYSSYFECVYGVYDSKTKTYNNETGLACPNGNPPSSVRGKTWVAYYLPTNETQFCDDISSIYGVDCSWLNMTTYVRQEVCPKSEPNCKTPEYALMPDLMPDFSIQDPSSLIQQSLSNYTALSDWLNNAAVASSLGLLFAETADVVDGSSTAVFTTAAAVAAMQQVSDLGAKAEKEEREELIFAFLSAFLLVLPGLGEIAEAATDIASIARIATLVSDLGNAAMALYDAATNPSNAAVDIVGALLGAVGHEDDSIWAQAAKIRRETPDGFFDDLGTDVADNMGKVKKTCKTCSP